MNEQEEVRVCKNKECQKVLPAGYKYKYCEACRNKRAESAKRIVVGIAGSALSISLGFFAGRWNNTKN